MSSKKSVFIFGILCVMVLVVGAWAVQSQVNPNEVEPADFDADDPDDYPQTTDIDIDIIGMSDAQIGRILMLEGIENETTVNFAQGGTSAGSTSYPRLVFHGVFEREMREWRANVINGQVTKRDIELDLNNSSNRRVLRVRFENCWPTKFSLPPLSVEGSTRYLERMEFVYDSFEIKNF